MSRTKTGENKECQSCKAIFYVPLNKIKIGKGKYCSRICSEKARTKPVDRVCKFCGNGFRKHVSTIAQGRGAYCSRECGEKDRKNFPSVKKGRKYPHLQGVGSSTWKGGRIKRCHGYITLYQPHHPSVSNFLYVLEHRLVAEKALGRFLTDKEIIHHINGVTDDNHIENLYLFKTTGEHVSYHFRVKSNKTQPITKSNLL